MLNGSEETKRPQEFGSNEEMKTEAEPRREETKRRHLNVFDAIMETGHDEDFVPRVTKEFCPTDAPAGSPAKVQVLAERVRKGLPLWHPEDRVSYSGLTGSAIRARD